MVISTIADGLLRGVETVQDTVSEAFFEPVIRLGVTGLARSGKTVFITSLVANLLDQGRMPHLLAASEGRIKAAFLQPQPDDTVPRFESAADMAALAAQTRSWPESTRAISKLGISLQARPDGLLEGLTRVFSLLVLGLSLSGLAWLNRWTQEVGPKNRSNQSQSNTQVGVNGHL